MEILFILLIILFIYIFIQKRNKNKNSIFDNVYDQDGNIVTGKERDEFFKIIHNSKPDYIIAPERTYADKEKWESDEKIIADYQEELFRQEHGLDDEYEDLDDFLNSQDEESKKRRA